MPKVSGYVRCPVCGLDETVWDMFTGELVCPCGARWNMTPAADGQVYPSITGRRKVAGPLEAQGRLFGGGL